MAILKLQPSTIHAHHSAGAARDEPSGGARLRRADFIAGGDASTASVSGPGFSEDAHCVRLASLESGLDGVSPHRPNVPTFKGNVKTIRTDVLVDRAAEDLYPTWEKNREQWNMTGGDHPYHYLGSAIWFTRIGHAMAQAMAELLPAR